MFCRSIVALFASCLFFASQASAFEDTSPFLSLGYDAGGETLFAVPHDDGSSIKIKTHSGLRFGGGAVFSLPSEFELEAGIYYKLDTSETGNDKISFSSLPIEILFAKRLVENHRIGAGLVHSVNNKMKIDVNVLNDEKTEDFKDATGWLLQYDFTFDRNENTPGWRIGLRYTIIELESKIVEGKKDGDSAGILVSVLF